MPCENELLQECEALILYVARHGDVLKQKDETDEESFAAYDGLVAAVNQKDDWVKLRENYARVTARVHAAKGISGRSVFDTLKFGTITVDPDLKWWQKCLWYLRRLNICRLFKGPWRPMTLGVIFFLLALLLQAAVGRAGRINDPGQELGPGLLSCYWMIKDLAPLLLAGLWGGIGSCIFLMKKLTDRLSAMTYEQSRQKGDLARIFVGFFLGIAAVEIFLDDDLGEAMMVGDANLTPNLIALAAGIATKTVYGLLEALIEGIAERVSPKRKNKGTS